eukprot:CAMPEP_0204083518 /NCGR_PEP_ID=MMETSP0360-20130528/178639_1 /ASSEMBLY_ACC=CAM_ASM_000342 /TAXON_ID=268821 /ORGANISM="Scrippsiella Hangoei, Strain SHTV-5" /LENGTH=88 /DNA_ID=CAMNT_0051032457 /DNA_START=112 /DNA_END=375 /DNA_ORIENTATION=+
MRSTCPSGEPTMYAALFISSSTSRTNKRSLATFCVSSAITPPLRTERSSCKTTCNALQTPCSALRTSTRACSSLATCASFTSSAWAFR